MTDFQPPFDDTYQYPALTVGAGPCAATAARRREGAGEACRRRCLGADVVQARALSGLVVDHPQPLAHPIDAVDLALEVESAAVRILDREWPLVGAELVLDRDQPRPGTSVSSVRDTSRMIRRFSTSHRIS